jgi:hypothetical protein
VAGSSDTRAPVLTVLHKAARIEHGRTDETPSMVVIDLSDHPHRQTRRAEHTVRKLAIHCDTLVRTWTGTGMDSTTSSPRDREQRFREIYDAA